MAGAAAPELIEATVAVYRLNLDDAPGKSQAPFIANDREWVEPLLQQNAVWFCRLRWMVIAALGSAGLAGFFPGPLQALGLALSPWWTLTAAGVLAGLNLVFVNDPRHGRPLPAGTALYARPRPEMARQARPAPALTAFRQPPYLVVLLSLW